MRLAVFNARFASRGLGVCPPVTLLYCIKTV